MNATFLRLVLLVARRDYLRTVRRRGFLIATLLLPLGMATLMLISGFAAASATPPTNEPVLVVNESSLALQPDPQLTPNVQLVSRSDAESRLRAGEVDTYYVVPATWPTPPNVTQVQLPQAETHPLNLMVGSSNQQGQVTLLLRVSLLRDAGLPDSTLGELLSPIVYDPVTPDGSPVSEGDIAALFLLPYVFTLIFFLGIFITSGYLLQSVNEEKETRVVEILLSSVPALPLMAGKILGLGAAGLTQILIWLVTAFVALPLVSQQLSIDVAIAPTTLVMTLVFYLVGYLTYGAVFAAIGAIASGQREAQQLSSFIVLPAIIPIVMLTWFLRDTSSPIVWLLSVLPLTAPSAIFEVLAVSPSPPWVLVGISLISQLAFGLLAVFVSGRIFRATVLLVGTRPSLKRIAGAIFARS